MEAFVKSRRLGGSLIVRIPREIVEEEQITTGQTLIIDIKKPKKDFFGALKDISSFNKRDELDINE